MNRFWYNHPIPQNALKSKLTNEPILSDKFNRYHNYLRISLTEKCNMKCRYCVYDQDIQYSPKSKLLSPEQFVHLTKLFVKSGVSKIRLTGGEPTIYKGISKFVYEIGNLPGVKTLAMTSNGSILYKKLSEFQENGLTHLNLSLDTFKPEKAEYITQTRFHSNVLKSIDKALELNISPLKINCVVMKGVNDDEIYDFIEFVRDKPINIRFIEFFSIGDNGWSKDKTFSFNSLKQHIEQKYGPLKPKNDHYTETAKNFNLEGIKGDISFITSVTKPFCGTCNRIRLLSTGEFRRCLHDDNMFNIKEALDKGYSDDVILEGISQHLKGKKKAHAGMDVINSLMKNGVEMIKIGG